MSQFDDCNKSPTNSSAMSTADFLALLSSTVNDKNFSDQAFRRLVSNTLPAVNQPSNSGYRSAGGSSSQFDGPFPTR